MTIFILLPAYNEEDSIPGKGGLRKNGIGERGLARSGASGDQDVETALCGRAQHESLLPGHRAVADIIVQTPDHRGPFADRERRRAGDGRQHPLKPFPRPGQDSRESGIVARDGLADIVCDQTNDPLPRLGRQGRARILSPFAAAVEDQTAVGIGEDLDNCRLNQGGQDGLAQCMAQRLELAFSDDGMGGHQLV